MQDSLKKLTSPAIARLVAWFALIPDQPTHLRALQRATGLGMRSLTEALAALEGAGVIKARREGVKKCYTADTTSDAWRAWYGLVRVTATPAEMLQTVAGSIPSLLGAFVFGSLAAGTEQPDSDIDVMLILEDARPRLPAIASEALMEVGSMTGREVNPKVVTYSELAGELRAGRAFYQNVVKGPMQWVAGDPRILRRLVAA